MLFSQGKSYHRNYGCTFLYQLCYDKIRKKHQHCIYIYLVQVSAMFERVYDFVLVEAALRLSWHFVSSPARPSNLLAYAQHVQLLGHLFHGRSVIVLNFCTSKDSKGLLQKGSIVLVGAFVEYKKPQQRAHHTNSKCALSHSVNWGSHHTWVV